MADGQETIAAIATPAGRGGIGIVRISGPGSPGIAEQLTGTTPTARHAAYARFRDRDGGTLDRGILLYFQGPHSFTGEDVVELQGHGGRVVLDMLLNRVIELGARHARPGEFTERAYLNGKIDLLQAEAVADIIDSVSERAARNAMHSLEGEFSRRIRDVVERVIEIRVNVEGSLDFSEEEIDLLSETDIEERIKGVIQSLDDILNRSRRGIKIREGLRVAIVGRPNVGKSSLMNCLSETDRAIVTSVPGTTRDVIEQGIVIDGLFLNIVDTAGIHVTDDPVEQEGIRRALSEIRQADLVLMVAEYGSDREELGSYLDEYVPRGSNVILIYNKIDLHAARPSIDEDRVTTISLSARSGEGMELLAGRLREIAMGEEQGEDLLLARARHITALERAKMHIEDGLNAYHDAGAAELLAEQLRKAQGCLGEITGEFSSDDLLGEIFASFCIGK